MLHPVRIQLTLRPPRIERLVDPGQVLLYGAERFLDLDEEGVELELVAFSDGILAAPVHVSDEVLGLVVDHDALVEGVEAEEAVLPSLALLTLVVREETLELIDCC